MLKVLICLDLLALKPRKVGSDSRVPCLTLRQIQWAILRLSKVRQSEAGGLDRPDELGITLGLTFTEGCEAQRKRLEGRLDDESGDSRHSPLSGRCRLHSLDFTTQTSSIPFLRAVAERVPGEEFQQESEGSLLLAVRDD